MQGLGGEARGMELRAANEGEVGLGLETNHTTSTSTALKRTHSSPQEWREEGEGERCDLGFSTPTTWRSQVQDSSTSDQPDDQDAADTPRSLEKMGAGEGRRDDGLSPGTEAARERPALDPWDTRAGDRLRGGSDRPSTSTWTSLWVDHSATNLLAGR